MWHRFAFFSEGKEKFGMNIHDFGSEKRIGGDNFLDIQDTEDIFTGTFAKAVRKFLPKEFGEMSDMGMAEKVRRFSLYDDTPIDLEKSPVISNQKSFFKKLFGN